ncbi:zinc-dependent alcohol dehydrogenase family protein [Cecembia calidifontis]|jgi:propanol-preferring alcohol dehydrogenase|uniref:Propanol-preferring alcohol dehydrogenase n=1 Tax=Cecembia calidifontis TaxID=1187080 RepID=A0A4Q7PBG7_9BACT|nr:zinc-dependent alcohol dehydrogenase family protein [Cecembia calidifontis]RZS97646.1 propanol-preferring alcohol dehydrogenase [Cecembia calidifontis]
MKAWLLKAVSDLTKVKTPLTLEDFTVSDPKENQVLIKVFCCGICHTELDEIEGRTPPPFFPVIPGHQVIGIVEKVGEKVSILKEGERVGVAWIFSACGHCEYCEKGLENLCPDFKATGRDANGGYAEYMLVDEKFAFPIPQDLSDFEAAPLLCAGAIGYRSLKLTGLSDGQALGLTGFGSSGHLVLKMAKFLFPNSPIFVFARSIEEQQFSLRLGADWAGDIDEVPPKKLLAIIDTTPVWRTVIGSLHHLNPAGRLVINAIRKESQDMQFLLNLNYPDHLWMEKEIKSVANITRLDVEEFLQLAAKVPIRPQVEVYPFEKANEALVELKRGHIKGAKVLDCLH